MDELGYVVEALLILNLVIGKLDDVVAHACECGGALGIGEARGFAVMSGAALAFRMTPMLSVKLSMRMSA